MKKLTLILLILFTVPSVYAAGSNYPLDKAPVDLSDKESMQRGAKYFVNYCMGCHAMTHLRYNRLGRDLGIPDRLVESNLIFTTDEEGSPTKVGEQMNIAMDQLYAEASFGVVPPDLTLTARSRGANWIYTYMRTFYIDHTQQWGMNNAVFPNVGMPHVLWQLQGIQKAVFDAEEDAGDNGQIVGFEVVKAGSMSAEEYDQLVADLTNFMVYAAEPAKLFRYKLGVWAMAFLLLFLLATWLLKKEYWRDIK